MFWTVLDNSRLVGGRDEIIKMLNWLIVKGDDTRDGDGRSKIWSNGRGGLGIENSGWGPEEGAKHCKVTSKMNPELPKKVFFLCFILPFSL